MKVSRKQDPLFEEKDAIFQRLHAAAGVRSDTDLAKALGITAASVSVPRRQPEKQIPPNWLLILSDKYDVSLDWLYRGEGPMRRGEKKEDVWRDLKPGQALSLGAGAADKEFEERVGLILVPKVRARLSAGNGSLETSGDVVAHYAFRQDWIKSKGRLSSMVLMEASGDSMEPVIWESDTLLLDQSQTDILSGKIYGIGLDEEVIVKYVDKLPGKYVFRSANPCYAPIEVDLADESLNVRIIGRVVWWCREAR